MYALGCPRRLGQLCEKRWFLNVCARGCPVVEHSGACWHGVPLRIRLPDVAVPHVKLFGVDALLHRTLHLLSRGPDVAEENGHAVLPGADWFTHQIDIGRAGQCVRHHKRRACQPIGLHQWIDSPFKVAVARENGCSNQIPVANRLGNLRGQRTGVANACRAPVPNCLKPQRVQILVQPRPLEVIRNNPRARGEARLHPRLCCKTLCDCLSSQKACSHHHAWVTCIGATRNSRDHDRAVMNRRGATVLVNSSTARTR